MTEYHGISGTYSDFNPTLEAEVRLIRWSESSTAGRTITIELPPDAGEGHPFKGFPTGHANGQRFRMSFVPIADDEEPIARENAAKAELRAALLASEAADRKNPNLSLVGKQRYANESEMGKARDRACMYSTKPKFWSWIEDVSNYMVTDEAGAAEYIRLEIGATSRRMIATNPEIYQRYIERVEMPFQQWAGLMPELRA